MGVYFGRLFDLMIKRNINQETLCQACNISTKTLAAMRRGMMPSMEVIDKICNYLDPRFPAPLHLRLFSPLDRDRRFDSPALSGRHSRPSWRTSR